MSYRFLEPGQIAIHDDRWFVPPWGVNGGHPGARARKILEKADGSKAVVGNKVEDVAVEANDILHFITWGGGGWGDPLERDPALVAKEVIQGLVTPSGALSYGVVVDDKGTVDTEATGKMRGDLRAERGNTLPTFDYGPPIEQLRERCLEETGLTAPRQPEWTSYAIAAE
jgi:N-methylhydantoinase B